MTQKKSAIKAGVPTKKIVISPFVTSRILHYDVIPVYG